MKKLFLVLAVVGLVGCATTASAQFSVNPNLGASFITKDGVTTRIGELVADIGYAFPWGDAESDPRWWGELIALYGLGQEGNQLGGIGFRTYIRQGGVYPGFGVQSFVVDAGVIDQIAETSITVAPEILLEIPWAEETILEDGTILVTESRITGYAAVYFPVSGDTDFTMVRFGIRTGI